MTTRRTQSSVLKLTAAGLLTAIGIMIPMFSPLRFVMGAASYTPASHVAIFVAMFISPWVAVLVTFGTTLGFFLGGFPPVIVFRAASHIVFIIIGSYYLTKINKEQISPVHLRVFSIVIALIHAFAEVVAVFVYYLIAGVPATQGVMWVLGFIGLGTIIHSLFDFELANAVRLVLRRQKFYIRLSQ